MALCRTGAKPLLEPMVTQSTDRSDPRDLGELTIIIFAVCIYDILYVLSSSLEFTS